MIYLSSVEAGGRTIFPQVRIPRTDPRPGGHTVGAVDFHWSSIGMWWQLHVKLLSLIYFSVVWYLTYEVANCLHCNVVLTKKLFRVTCSKDIFTQSWRCSPLFVWGIRWKDNRDCKQSYVFWRFNKKNWQNGPRARQSFSFQKFTGTLKSNIFGKFANTFLLLQGTIANKNIRNQKGAKKISPGQF